MAEEYLKSVTSQFEYYKKIAERTFEQLSEEQLHRQYDEESNSIATIIKHMGGNMLSRWTDFLTTDGEKDWRDRESEFNNCHMDRVKLLGKWDEGWSCLFTALSSLNKDDFDSIINIRNQRQSAMDAICRQLAHYSYHIGQIVFIGKMVLGEQWNSLSIPRGRSNEFNNEKFSNPKQETFSEET
jgi:hypothetical protein